MNDLTPAETSAMNALEGGAWTPTRLLPPDALTTLTTRGLVEVSTWQEWAKLTRAGVEMFAEAQVRIVLGVEE